MTHQYQPHVLRWRGFPDRVSVSFFLLLTTIACEILNAVTIDPRPWTIVLNLLLAGINAILAFLQWAAQRPPEAYSVPVSCLSVMHNNGRGGFFFQKKGGKNARLASPNLKRRKATQNLVPGSQNIVSSIEAGSQRIKRNLLHKQMKVTTTRRRPSMHLLTTPTVSLSKAPTRILTDRPEVATEVLLVCVTDIEVQAILTVFPNAIKTVIQNRTFYNLGRVGQTQTCMVQATGAGPGGVRTCIEDGIRTLSPEAIILVGIAFGLQANCQQIGDVLVSRQVQDYDPQRYGTGPDQQLLIHLRGNRVTASEWLLDRFCAGKHDWDGFAAIHVGLLLSGSLLIDHHEMCERLLGLTPEALGGEMEGATLCDVALRNHVSWIVVKAIADWADGNKQHYELEQQKYAAENAAQFVYHVLRQSDFIQKKNK